MESLQSDFDHMRITNERLQEEMSSLQAQYDMPPGALDDIRSPGQGRLKVKVKGQGQKRDH